MADDEFQHDGSKPIDSTEAHTASSLLAADLLTTQPNDEDDQILLGATPKKTPVKRPRPSAGWTTVTPSATDRPAKDPINIAIYISKQANPKATWPQIAEAVQQQFQRIKPISHASCLQRYHRSKAAIAKNHPVVFSDTVVHELVQSVSRVGVPRGAPAFWATS